MSANTLNSDKAKILLLSKRLNLQNDKILDWSKAIAEIKLQ